MSHSISGNSYGRIKDTRGRTLSVGHNHPKNSTKNVDAMRFVNHRPPNVAHWVRDPLIFMAQQIVMAITLVPVIMTPYPGLPDASICDSCMRTMCVTAVQHGYTVSTPNPAFKIHKNNQITKANKAFARSFVETLSLYLFYNQRTGWSGVSDRAKTTSTDDSRALEAIQVVLLHQMATAHPQSTAALFPGTFPLLVLSSHAAPLILVCCCHTLIGGIKELCQTEAPICAKRHHLISKAKNGVITSFAGLKAHPKAMWVHHYFLWSCISAESRQRLAKYPRPTDLKPPTILDRQLPGAFPWTFFVKHICTADVRNGISAVPYRDIPHAEQRHCFQWKGYPLTVDMEEFDSGDDDFADSD